MVFKFRMAEPPRKKLRALEDIVEERRVLVGGIAMTITEVLRRVEALLDGLRRVELVMDSCWELLSRLEAMDEDERHREPDTEAG